MAEVTPVTTDSTIRPARFDDVAAIRAILAAHGEDGPVARVDIVGPYLRHCIRHGIALVSERGGQVVGYGAGLDTGVVRHLADLFVRPDLVGLGIGGALLDAVFAGASRRTTFSSSDARALPIYVLSRRTVSPALTGMRASQEATPNRVRWCMIDPWTPSRSGSSSPRIRRSSARGSRA